MAQISRTIKLESSELLNNINKDNVPKHIAIIMDGNGRWAKKRTLPRIVGHEYGVKTVRNITETAAKLGVKYLTLYTFSTENWNRPKLEVMAIMALLQKTIKKETETLIKNNIRLRLIGNIAQLPNEVQRELEKSLELTKNNTRMDLILALNYSARWDITNATQLIAYKIKNQDLLPENITQETIAQHLTTSNFPNPELVIRTSGEYRISNFLLWEMAYSELHFTEVFWPEFSDENFYKAILDYQNRERRFGKTSEQIEQNESKA